MTTMNACRAVTLWLPPQKSHAAAAMRQPYSKTITEKKKELLPKHINQTTKLL